MTTYPFIICFRYDKYSYVDSELSKINKSITFTSDPKDCQKLFDPSYQILVTIGEDEKDYYQHIYSTIVERFRFRWLHFNPNDLSKFYNYTNYCFITNSINDRKTSKPKFSLFTACYNTFSRIDRVYQSLLRQTLKDWEWIIIDDSTDVEHFPSLQKKFSNDSRVRLYNRGQNCGNIGNVKNEGVSLSRGQYVLELDHDDELTPWCLSEAEKGFASDPDIGFLYMDFANIYENGTNFSYGNRLCAGYGGYYNQKYEGKWMQVYITPSINNVTTRFGLPCLPNHPRIWNREFLLSLGNYCPFLPISDDLEILLKTIRSGKKILKLCSLGYIQYMNDGGNNCSLTRNGEINRLAREFIIPQFFNEYKLDTFFMEHESQEEYTGQRIWELPDDYIHKHINLKEKHCKKEYLFLSLSLDKMKELSENSDNEVLFLTYKYDYQQLCFIMNNEGLSKVRFYSLKGETTSKKNLEQYFKLLYKGDNTEYIIIDDDEEEKKIIINYNF